MKAMSKSLAEDQRVASPSSGSHDSQSETCSSPSTRPKRTKRASKWQENWKRYHMKASKKGKSYGHCNICCTDSLVGSMK